MKEPMKELLRKYIKPIPLLSLAVCVYAGYLIALDQGALVKNFVVMILAGIFVGSLFSYGYVEKKYQIFLWALVGTVIASATAMIEGEKQVLITNLFLEVFSGALVGFLIGQSPRGVAIGALAFGLFFGGLAVWVGVADSNGVKVENQTLAVIQVFMRYAWKGAWYGGMFGASLSNYKTGKIKTKSEPA